MKLHELFKVLCVDSLVCIEDDETDEVLFCCEFGDITLGGIRPISDATVKTIYPEPYGNYYFRHGITIRISRA